MDDSTPKKPCSKCGVEKDATLDNFPPNKGGKYGLYSVCRECKRQYDQERLSNPEIKAHNKQVRTRPERKKRTAEQAREYRKSAAYQEYIKEYDQRPQRKLKVKEARKRYFQTPNGIAKQKEYRESPKIKAWEKEYRQRPEVRERNRLNKPDKRIRKSGLPNTFTAKDWRRCLGYWGHKCCICGREADATHSIAKEHWIPIRDRRSDNPGHVAENVLPMCHSITGGRDGCNNTKWRHDPLTWLRRRYPEDEVQRIVKAINDYFDWIKSIK